MTSNKKDFIKGWILSKIGIPCSSTWKRAKINGWFCGTGIDVRLRSYKFSLLGLRVLFVICTRKEFKIALINKSPIGAGLGLGYFLISATRENQFIHN